MNLIPKYIWSRKKSGLSELSAAEYRNALIDVSADIAERAFNKAWETRNFEIEMYWKRATYFWAFIASTFVAYFALVGADTYAKPDSFDHVEVYVVACIGFVLSYAWWATNKGSKAWQRHWEVHVDLLEDKFTGPLYKIVHPTDTYSVSKINEIVSLVFVCVWFGLGVKYLVQQDLLNMNFDLQQVNWWVVGSTLVALLAVTAMEKGHGRGRFSERPIRMYRRKSEYIKDQET